MTYKVINNTGLSGDTLVYNEETADRVVPGGLPVAEVAEIRYKDGRVFRLP